MGNNKLQLVGHGEDMPCTVDASTPARLYPPFPAPVRTRYTPLVGDALVGSVMPAPLRSNTPFYAGLFSCDTQTSCAYCD